MQLMQNFCAFIMILDMIATVLSVVYGTIILIFIIISSDTKEK